MSEKVCDRTSVGMIVEHEGAVLLIERQKPPYGFAAPAGHIDGDPTPEAAGKRELYEEVGLRATSQKCVLEKDFDLPCRRPGGTWHHWTVLSVDAKGNINPSQDETKQALWASRDKLSGLAKKTEDYLAGRITELVWQADPGLELVWYYIFTELGFIDKGENE